MLLVETIARMRREHLGEPTRYKSTSNGQCYVARPNPELLNRTAPA